MSNNLNPYPKHMPSKANKKILQKAAVMKRAIDELKYNIDNNNNNNNNNDNNEIIEQEFHPIENEEFRENIIENFRPDEDLKVINDNNGVLTMELQENIYENNLQEYLNLIGLSREDYNNRSKVSETFKFKLDNNNQFIPSARVIIRYKNALSKTIQNELTRVLVIDNNKSISYNNTNNILSLHIIIDKSNFDNTDMQGLVPDSFIINPPQFKNIISPTIRINYLNKINDNKVEFEIRNVKVPSSNINNGVLEIIFVSKQIYSGRQYNYKLNIQRVSSVNITPQINFIKLKANAVIDYDKSQSDVIDTIIGSLDFNNVNTIRIDKKPLSITLIFLNDSNVNFDEEFVINTIVDPELRINTLKNIDKINKVLTVRINLQNLQESTLQKFGLNFSYSNVNLPKLSFYFNIKYN